MSGAGVVATRENDFVATQNFKQGVRISAPPRYVENDGVINVTVGAIDIRKTSTGAKAITLKDGREGDLLSLEMTTYTSSGASVVTPSNFAQGTTLSFDAAGEVCTLVFRQGKWRVLGLYGATIA